MRLADEIRQAVLFSYVVDDILNVQYLLGSQYGNVEGAVVCQSEQIVGADVECAANFDYHINRRLNAAVFPVADALLYHEKFSAELYLIQPGRNS